MGEVGATLEGPDFARGVELSKLPDGTMLLGHARGAPVLFVRRSHEIFAIGAICTHYGAPLEQGFLVGATIRCPWHHACFSLRTGDVLRAPARDAVSRWHVEQVCDRARQFTPAETPLGAVYVREKLETAAPLPRPLTAGMPASVVIVGGGAAGNAAAETLRREGYSGGVTMLSADQSRPCDRPDLSKGYLAGTASEESNHLRPLNWYGEQRIDLRLNARVAAIDAGSGQIEMADGSRSPMVRCSSPPAPRPCTAKSPAAIFRTCTIWARSQTAARWLTRQRRAYNAPWWSARRRSPWRRSSDRRSGSLSANFTRNMA